MRSGSATEVPPNFWTRRATAENATGRRQPARNRLTRPARPRNPPVSGDPRGGAPPADRRALLGCPPDGDLEAATAEGGAPGAPLGGAVRDGAVPPAPTPRPGGRGAG